MYVGKWDVYGLVLLYLQQEQRESAVICAERRVDLHLDVRLRSALQSR
jgi:hypothetical protein